MGKTSWILGIVGVGAIVAGAYWLYTQVSGIEFPFKFPEFRLPTLPEIFIAPITTPLAEGAGAVLGGLGATIGDPIVSVLETIFYPYIRTERVKTIERIKWGEQFEAKAEEIGVKLAPTTLVKQNGEVVATRAPYIVYPQRVPTQSVMPPFPVGEAPYGWWRTTPESRVSIFDIEAKLPSPSEIEVPEGLKGGARRGYIAMMRRKARFDV